MSNLVVGIGSFVLGVAAGYWLKDNVEVEVTISKKSPEDEKSTSEETANAEEEKA